MGRHTNIEMSGRQLEQLSRPIAKRPLRSTFKLSLAAFAAAFGFVLVMVVDPYSGAYADEAVAPSHWGVKPLQTLAVGNTDTTKLVRGTYGVKLPKPKVVAPAAVSADEFAAAPAAGTPDPGSAKAIAAQLVAAKGWGANQYNCLVSLWNKESGWNVYAANPSGAYGIPQALPGNKMASAGPNWQSNATTQIKWGLGYIQARYNTPCGAWAQSEAHGYY